MSANNSRTKAPSYFSHLGIESTPGIVNDVYPELKASEGDGGSPRVNTEYCRWKFLSHARDEGHDASHLFRFVDEAALITLDAAYIDYVRALGERVTNGSKRDVVIDEAPAIKERVGRPIDDRHY
jgi:hypothetical protein